MPKTIIQLNSLNNNWKPVQGIVHYHDLETAEFKKGNSTLPFSNLSCYHVLQEYYEVKMPDGSEYEFRFTRQTGSVVAEGRRK